MAKAVGQMQEMGRNLIKIMKHLTENQDLMRYLVYTDTEPLKKTASKPDLKANEVLWDNIRITPRKHLKDDTSESSVILRVVGADLNENQEFRNVAFHIEVFVPLTQWKLRSENLRPFLIMSEITKSLDGQPIEGLGKLELGDFQLNFLTEEMSSYEMHFWLTSYA